MCLLIVSTVTQRPHILWCNTAATGRYFFFYKIHRQIDHFCHFRRFFLQIHAFKALTERSKVTFSPNAPLNQNLASHPMTPHFLRLCSYRMPASLWKCEPYTRIHLILQCPPPGGGVEQGRSQPHSPGWARVPLSSFFPQILINLSYFSSNFTHFLPHFGSPPPTREGPGYATGVEKEQKSRPFRQTRLSRKEQISSFYLPVALICLLTFPPLKNVKKLMSCSNTLAAQVCQSIWDILLV